MDKILSVGANIAIIVSIVVCIWLGDNIDASGREMFSAFLILILGLFCYVQKIAYAQKEKR